MLVAVGLSIALSGWLLRKRAETWQPRPAKTLSDSLYAVLIALAVISYLSKRLIPVRADFVPSPADAIAPSTGRTSVLH